MSGSDEQQQQAPIQAPSLAGAVDWLNVAAPVTIEQLRGKVVILDFWTYGCVNCMHVLRDLKTLEQRFPDELVVVGVHSAKFANEKSTDNLKRILVRYEIEHPVANDANLEIWRRYGAQAWPTRIIIDPAGNLVGTAMGEGNLEGFVNAIRTVVRIFDERGEINRSPLPLQLERQRHDDQPLLYPGKLLADEQSNRLFVADSNHNRIVVSSLDGRLIEVIGSGLQGDNDGIFSQARFYRPQGLALDLDCARGRRRSAVCRRHREPSDPRRRFPGACGAHRRGHRQAGCVERRGRRRVAGRSQFAVGSCSQDRHPDRRDGGVASAVGDRSPARPGVSVRRHRGRSEARRRREPGDVRAAVRPRGRPLDFARGRRQHVVCRGRGIQHDSRGAAASGEHGHDNRRR